MISNQVLIEPFDIAKMCEQCLQDPSMSDAILSSWRSVGLFPFDESRILRKLKLFKTQEQDGKDKEMLDNLMRMIEEKYSLQQKAQDAKKKRKVS